MSNRCLGLVAVGLVLPLLAWAQDDPLATLSVYRCAVGGQHLEGCPTSARVCSFEEYLAGTCPQTGEAPTEPVPTEPAPTRRAPAELSDGGTGVTFVHDGVLTHWYTLRIDGAYHTHVDAAARTLPFVEPLPAGTYAVTVEACSDAGGCTTSAPLTLRR